MNKKIILVASVATALSLYLTNCKKKEADVDPIKKDEITIVDETAMALQSNDNSDVENHLSDAMSDINSYGNGNTFRLDESTCVGVNYANSTITATGGIRKKLTINFNSSNCKGYLRSGTANVTLTSGMKFSDVGATWNVSFDNYTVVKNGKTTIMNGNWTVTNNNGGYVGGTTEVTHNITGDVSVVFENGTSRSWTVSEYRVWAANAASLKIYGNGNYRGYNDVVRYGTNRNGITFYTRINGSSPVVISKINCSNVETLKYVSGSRIHTVEKEDGLIKRIESISLNESTCINTYSVTIEKKDKTVTRTVTF